MLDLDRQSRKPIYEQIAESYKHLITSGALLPDEPLPTRERLARELSLNPHTVEKALEVLREEGYIYMADGKQICVSDRGSWEQQEQQAFFTSLEQMVQRGKKLHITREEFLCRMEEYLREDA